MFLPIAGSTDDGCDFHRVSSPASRTNSEPVTYLAASETKNNTACATSSGSIHGTGSRLPADRSAISRGLAPSSAASPSFMGVFTPVGWSEMTRILCGASSMAQDLVKPVNPHFDAA